MVLLIHFLDLFQSDPMIFNTVFASYSDETLKGLFGTGSLWNNLNGWALDIEIEAE